MRSAALPVTARAGVGKRPRMAGVKRVPGSLLATVGLSSLQVVSLLFSTSVPRVASAFVPQSSILSFLGGAFGPAGFSALGAGLESSLLPVSSSSLLSLRRRQSVWVWLENAPSVWP